MLRMALRSQVWLQRLAVGGLLIATVGLVMGPMIVKGYPHTHSVYFNMMWAFQYSEQVMGGQWYPRWLEGSFYGLGNPTFVFYPPLCMITVVPFRVLGLSTSAALIGSMVLATAARGVGAYRAGRCLGSRGVAVTVALGAVISPYFMINIYERGAIGEVWAMSVLPWIFWAGWRVTFGLAPDPESQATNTGVYSRWLVLAITYGLMGLTHLPTLLIWTGVWLLWPFCHANNRAHLWSLSLHLYSATVVGLAFASYYLLPAALDQQWVNIEAINAWEIYDPLQRFMTQVTLWPLQWNVTEHPYDRTLLPYFWIPLGVAGLGGVIGLLSFRQQTTIQSQRSGRVMLYLSVITMIASLMMTSTMAWAYQASSTLTRIQFPWRWMTVTFMAVPFLMGVGVTWVESRVQRYLQAVGLMVIISILVICWLPTSHITYQALFNRPLMIQFNQIMDQRPAFPQEPQVIPGSEQHFLGWHWLYPEGLVFIDAFEYRPLTASGQQLPAQQHYQLVDWVNGTGHSVVRAWNYGYRRFTTQSFTGGTAALRTFDYPGWKVWINGELAMATTPAPDGRLQIKIPIGTTDVKVVYVGTETERLGGWISVGSLALAGGVWAWFRYRSRHLQTSHLQTNR